MVHIKYTDLPGGLEDWNDSSFTRPMPFDLVVVKTAQGEKRGWWTGNYWSGLRLNKKDKVTSWKKARELDYID